jgi:hypothetical protein
MPFTPNLAATTKSLVAAETCSLPVVAFSCAADSAATVRSPPAVTAVSSMVARVAAGSSSVSRSSPSSASMAANRMLEASQPMLLKDTTTPIVSLPVALA